MRPGFRVWRPTAHRETIRSSAADDLNLRDFCWCADAHRRAPIPGTLAHVDLGTLELVEPRDEGLLEAYGQVPRKHLTTVGVTRELKINAEFVRELDPTRLVSKEDARSLSVASVERLWEVRPM